MSYTGEIGEAAAAITVGTVVLAASATFAVAKGLGKAASATGKAVNTAVQKARYNAVKSDLSKTVSEADKLGSEMDRKLDDISSECYKNYEATVSELEKEYQKEPNTDKFMAQYSEARQKLNSEMEEHRKKIQDEYIPQIRSALQAEQYKLTSMQNDMERSIKNISDSEERRKAAMEKAENLIADTENMISDLQTRYKGSKLALKAVDQCTQSLEKAKEYLASGMWEAALTGAFSVRSAIYIRVKEMAEAECRTKQMYINAWAQLKVCENILNENMSISYTFDETRNSKAITKEIEDFSYYYRGSMEKYSDKLVSLKNRLSSADHHDMSTVELYDITEELTNWQNGFTKETITAYERLRNEMLRLETAKLLVKRYMNKGYALTALTEEDKALSPLDSQIYRMENKATGEKIVLRFNAEKDGNGHVIMKIVTEDHTEYQGTDEQIEASREKERLDNIEAISNSGVGKNVRLRQRCKNPGVRDEYQKRP